MTTQQPSKSALMPRPLFWSTVGIVAKREIVTRFLSKSFIISTLVSLLLILGVFVFAPKIGQLLEGGDSTVAATADVAAKLQQIPDITVKEVPNEAAARAAVESKEVDCAVVPSAHSLVGVKILTLSKSPVMLVDALSVIPEVEKIDTDAPNSAMTAFLPLGFGIVWMMTALGFGLSIANSVVEEKQTRIVEILLASISSRALLTGKIIGNTAAALVQILLFAAVSFFGMAINGGALPIADLVGPIAWFISLFLIGFVMVASLYAAAAALVSRTEDLANVQQPIMWLIMLPYFAIISLSSNPVALAVMSYIPFSAPVAVPMRVFLGQCAFWEPALALVILIMTTVAIIWVAAKIYDRGLLRTGKPLKWSQALKEDS